MWPQVINQAVEAMGLFSTQRLATLFDGMSRHSPEGVAFQRRAQQVGFKQAVRERDNAGFDMTTAWTSDRDGDEPKSKLWRHTLYRIQQAFLSVNWNVYDSRKLGNGTCFPALLLTSMGFLRSYDLFWLSAIAGVQYTVLYKFWVNVCFVKSQIRACLDFLLIALLVIRSISHRHQTHTSTVDDIFKWEHF